MAAPTCPREANTPGASAITGLLEGGKLTSKVPHTIQSGNTKVSEYCYI